jgi:FixJ family two-component response regulator
VILDMNMPVQGGRETARQLLDLNPKCRILVASGYGEEAEARTLPGSESISFLRKPFRAEQLAEAVGLALTRGG